MLVGDLSADPSAIPSLVKSKSDGAWIDVEKAFATGSGVAPTLTCQFQLDDGKGTRRDFALVCPFAMAPTTACSIFSSFTVCSGLWVTHILQSARTSLSLLGTPLLRWPGFTRLSGQVAGYNVFV